MSKSALLGASPSGLTFPAELASASCSVLPGVTVGAGAAVSAPLHEVILGVLAGVFVRFCLVGRVDNMLGCGDRASSVSGSGDVEPEGIRSCSRKREKSGVGVGFDAGLKRRPNTAFWCANGCRL